MAKPNFHDRSWDDVDWEAWSAQFSIRDRASSVGELQNGIATRYIEVQNLLSRLPPHAGKARNLVAMWRHEVNGYGRTITFAESARLLRRLDELHGQVTQQVEVARQAAKAARKQRQRTPLEAPMRVPAGVPRAEVADAAMAGASAPLEHSAASARHRHDAPRLDTAAARWLDAQASMARDCERVLKDTARPVTNRQFLAAIGAEPGTAIESLHCTRAAVPVRVLRCGPQHWWSSGLPNLEQFGIARYSVYRRDGASVRFEHAAGLRRPEDLAAEREAQRLVNAQPPGPPPRLG